MKASKAKGSQDRPAIDTTPQSISETFRFAPQSGEKSLKKSFVVLAPPPGLHTSCSASRQIEQVSAYTKVIQSALSTSTKLPILCLPMLSTGLGSRGPSMQKALELVASPDGMSRHHEWLGDLTPCLALSSVWKEWKQHTCIVRDCRWHSLMRQQQVLVGLSNSGRNPTRS